MLLHLARDRRRAIDPHDIYFLEATGQTTLVRLRSSRRLRDVRTLSNRVLPVSRTYLKRLWAAFGERA